MLVSQQHSRPRALSRAVKNLFLNTSEAVGSPGSSHWCRAPPKMARNGTEGARASKTAWCITYLGSPAGIWAWACQGSGATSEFSHIVLDAKSSKYWAARCYLWPYVNITAWAVFLHWAALAAVWLLAFLGSSNEQHGFNIISWHMKIQWYLNAQNQWTFGYASLISHKKTYIYNIIWIYNII